jgi:hypothetical protein
VLAIGILTGAVALLETVVSSEGSLAVNFVKTVLRLYLLVSRILDQPF